MAVEGSAPFTRRVTKVVAAIPEGKVLTYGGVAAAAGNPRGARVVTWVLHSSASKEGLPWHRVINSKGEISLKPGYGYELQRQLLESEGIEFGIGGRVDLSTYLWIPPRSTIDE
jgi:methylated-DNA-protein-cysteine methyltransferase-like protein